MGNFILEKFASRSRFWVFALILLTCSVALAIGSQDDLRITNSLSLGVFAAPNASSILDVHSTSQGVLLPRMTNTQLTGISAPAEGLIGYDTTNHELSVYDGSQWQKMFDAGNLTGTLPAGVVPPPTATTLGGVFSLTPVSHNFLTGVGTDGTPSKARPACADLSDSGAGCSTAGVSANTPSTLVLRDASGNFAAGTITASLTGNATTATALAADPADCASNTYATAINASGTLTCSAVSAASGLTGIVPIANGGTGQSTAILGFDALSPLTNAGDILTYGSGHNTRLGTVLGDVGKVLISGGALVPNSWSNSLSTFTLTNMNTSYGTASNTQRLVLPANTTTGLSALTNTAGLIAYDSTQGKPVYNNGSAWTAVGTGSGSGGVNFISNPDAETDTTGYATYSNTAQALPVTGTGGSPTVTWTRTTTTPLTGTGSFLFTKTAVNSQGQGASYDFTIDNASQARVMSIDFDYQVASGTFVAGATGVDSDIEVYIYDVTNGAVIQPSTYKLFSSATSPPSHFSSTFQTASNSTSYRLIFHTATTSASAFSVKFDSVAVAPSKYVYGTPITDWRTDSCSASWVTNTTVTCLSRQVGDSKEFAVKILLSGAPNNTALTVTIPNTIDTTKIALATSYRDSLGLATIDDSGVQGYPGVVRYGSSNTVRVLAINAAGTSAVDSDLSTTNPFTFGSGDGVQIRFSVPILGWSSSVQMSDNASQRVVAALYTGAPPTGTLANSFNTVTFGTKVTDSNAAYSGGLYVVPVSGWYDACAQTAQSATYALGSFALTAIAINGTAKYKGVQVTGGAEGTIYPLVCAKSIPLNAGDTISVQALNNATSPAFITDATTNFFSVHQVQGPATIAATDTVAAKMQGTTGATYTSGNITTVPYNTIGFDKTGMCSTSTSKCTLQISGVYRVCGATSVSGGTQTLGNTYNLWLYDNGAQINVLGGGMTAQASAAFTVITGGCVNGSFNGGDVLDLRYQGSSTGTLTFGSGTGSQYFSIERINGAGG